MRSLRIGDDTYSVTQGEFVTITLAQIVHGDFNRLLSAFTEADEGMPVPALATR